MSVIRILAITAGPDHDDEKLEHLIAERTHAYQGHKGFLGLDLLEPSDGRNVWLFMTRWEDAESFDDFVAGPTFADHDMTDRVAAFGAPQSTATELWSYRVAVTTIG